MSLSFFSFPGTINAYFEEKSQEQRFRRAFAADKIVNEMSKETVYKMPMFSDIELIENENHLLIKGAVRSLAAVCYEFSNMEQLPDGYCVQLGEWKLVVKEDIINCNRENKTIMMPPDYWLFMSSKLRDSIYADDVHPYVYVYEPFTFKKVLAYGIGVEATDWHEFNDITI
ncbi:hypothetical protein GON26_18195 [Flavobacterium sp. GA093]|uniref:Uncharacterized protein n=1 Tax=Flavobacterium hydrocarbonoxydans TaxID=2683249 RepID=A0A6I4NX45_9FLAO|nr:hypothetical protein [Flavobacterium hydrocarbonoxydans]MWB96299.1 hypothetical protein [Flavobacterium hydrocarbonoxydans]